jgi:uncharacterized phage protein (TIGR01671 family)
MTPMKYRCWRKVEDWELTGYEAVMTGRWCTSKAPDMSDAKPGTFDDVERDQYTGRQAADDREIYEGDIVTIHATRATDNWTGKIMWKDQRLAYDVVEPNRFFPGKVFHHSLYRAKVEVIGDMYENPELLEAAK